MPQAKHRYRVTIYLGKENYEKIEDLAQFLGLPVATMTRVILETGLNLSAALEVAKEVSEDGVK